MQHAVWSLNIHVYDSKISNSLSHTETDSLQTSKELMVLGARRRQRAM